MSDRIDWPPPRVAAEVFEGVTMYAMDLQGALLEEPAEADGAPGGFSRRFAALLALLSDCDPQGGGDERRGAPYKMLAYLGHLVGMDSAERGEFYKLCQHVGLTQRHAGHIIARVQDGTYGQVLEDALEGDAGLPDETGAEWEPEMDRDRGPEAEPLAEIIQFTSRRRRHGMSSVENLKMKKTRERYERRLADLRADEMLSDKAKRMGIEQAYSEARSAYEEYATQRRAEIAERVQQTRHAAFAAPSILGADKANVMLSYRDALARLDGVIDTSKLAAMLERAHETGDSIMAKALLRRAFELRSEGLVGDYLQRYPQERETWEAFMDASEESNRLETFGDSLTLGVAAPERPPELDHPDSFAEGAA